jgi:anti-anti-sigma regulatory factor
MPVELLKGDAEWALVLSGVVDIFDASSLHAAAQEAVTGAPSGVIARLAGAEAVDTATTQVLVVLKRTLAADGRTLCFEGAREPVLDFWKSAGLTAELA